MLAYQTATNGRDALEKFKTGSFDAVIMGKSLGIAYLGGHID